MTLMRSNIVNRKDKEIKLSEDLTLKKREVSRFEFLPIEGVFEIVMVNGKHIKLNKEQSIALADYYDLALNI